NQLIVFILDEQKYALYLVDVEKVVRTVEITSLPKAPGIVLGVINVQGKIIPVLNIRKRFSLPERAIGLNDQLIIAHTSKRDVALFVDSVQNVLEYSQQNMTDAGSIQPDMEHIDGVLKLDDDLVLIHDLSKFLYPEEEEMLEAIEELKSI
ncbi:MAG: chemotaxis protein CheW, partial [Candidatus Anammoxibacter sp.]